MVLERWTNPKRSRLTCSPRYGLQSCRGKSTGVAKRPRERSPTRNPNVTIRNFCIAHRVGAQHESALVHTCRSRHRRETLARAARQHDDPRPSAPIAEHLRQPLLLREDHHTHATAALKTQPGHLQDPLQAPAPPAPESTGAKGNRSGTWYGRRLALGFSSIFSSGFAVSFLKSYSSSIG
jgi:hypothetical protein